MIRLLAASLLAFAAGCAHARPARGDDPDRAVVAGYPPPAPRPRVEGLGEAAGAAARWLDRAADPVSRVLYPPLYVAAFPLWFLAGGRSPSF